ncbi:hypothetical protein K435DRAFT_879397 [Dendrothele bispora CBS 962.96]|uniref:Uncharacterized protein n=1 Tax=Dendrothele bispora (strain CBS 962.96) TaxID=1314807 RepID=A0A4S8KL66_DENBC|nr:hypothetical protein K435DRAFT_879397 [Dendrothele bispora CBS 962.96]
MIYQTYGIVIMGSAHDLNNHTCSKFFGWGPEFGHMMCAEEVSFQKTLTSNAAKLHFYCDHLAEGLEEDPAKSAIIREYHTNPTGVNNLRPLVPRIFANDLVEITKNPKMKMHWNTFGSDARTYHFKMVGYPLHLAGLGPRSENLIPHAKYIHQKPLLKMIAPRIRHWEILRKPDSALTQEDREFLDEGNFGTRIVKWTKKELELPVEEQGSVALISDINGNSVMTVAEYIELEDTEEEESEAEGRAGKEKGSGKARGVGEKKGKGKSREDELEDTEEEGRAGEQKKERGKLKGVGEKKGKGKLQEVELEDREEEESEAEVHAGKDKGKGKAKEVRGKKGKGKAREVLEDEEVNDVGEVAAWEDDDLGGASHHVGEESRVLPLSRKTMPATSQRVGKQRVERIGFRVHPSPQESAHSHPRPRPRPRFKTTEPTTTQSQLKSMATKSFPRTSRPDPPVKTSAASTSKLSQNPIPKTTSEQHTAPSSKKPRAPVVGSSKQASRPDLPEASRTSMKPSKSSSGGDNTSLASRKRTERPLPSETIARLRAMVAGKEEKRKTGPEEGDVQERAPKKRKTMRG